MFDRKADGGASLRCFRISAMGMTPPVTANTVAVTWVRIAALRPPANGVLFPLIRIDWQRRLKAACEVAIPGDTCWGTIA